MAKRPSIRGRGVEILFGDPAPAVVEPRGPDLALVEAPPPEPEPAREQPADEAEALAPSLPPEPEPWFDVEEVERALLEEAQGGEPGPDEEQGDLSVLEPEPPTPEMERAFFEEAVAAEEPPEPVAEAPAPALEETMAEETLSEEAAIHEPPPPETSDVASDVLPPRPTRMFVELGETAPLTTADIQAGPEEKVERLELPDRELTEEERKQLLRWWGGARLQALDEEISKVYDQVLSKVGENEEIATECFNQLLQARDIVLRRDVAKFPQAEYYVEQVRARIKRAAESEAGAKKYGWRITGWGLLWCIAFLAVLIALNQSRVQEMIAPSASVNPAVDTLVLLSAMVWGGIGGVIAVWYSLFKHVGRRDFDTQYNHSYIGKPFLGAFLGAIVYLFFNLMSAIGILPAGLQQSGGTDWATVTPLLIYSMAWAGGFKENRIFDLVDRVIKRIFTGEEAESPKPAAGVEPAEPIS